MDFKIFFYCISGKLTNNHYLKINKIIKLIHGE